VGTNLTISEIVTIAVVILIVFGPHRLPEMAKRAGELVGRLRDAAASLRSELTSEYEDVARPFKDIESELRAAKADLEGSVRDAIAAGGDDPPPTTGEAKRADGDEDEAS
jgi:sec-independent protein translocase protein TatB